VRISAEYLSGTFEKSPAEVARECAAHFRQPARCEQAARWLRAQYVNRKAACLILMGPRFFLLLLQVSATMHYAKNMI